MKSALQEISGKITITRPSMGDGTDVIRVVITDDASRTTVFRGTMDIAEFAMCITGLSERPINGLANIGGVLGHRKVSEDRMVSVPPGVSPYGREEGEKWIEENCQEEGWIVDPSLRSQRSYTRVDGVEHFRYRVFKYVDESADALET